MTELTSLKNIGKTMEQKLKLVGIRSAEELRAIGSKAAYSMLKRKYPSNKAMCLVHLYVLEGAITNTEYNQLSESTKQDLKQYSDELKMFGA